MNKTLKSHLIATALLALVTVGGIAIAQHVVQAKDFDSRVETIEVDFEAAPAIQQSDVTLTDPKSDSPTQFFYLVGLAAIGLLGIVGVVRDVRSDNGL